MFQGQQPNEQLPNELVIGRHPFFDFGPPFNYYELILVRPGAAGSSVERVTLTPAADSCFHLAKVEIANASLKESVHELLGQTKPCAISDKKLRNELKRRKKGLVFSGADVFLQVQCQGKTRVIRADILDRDMFDAAPKTPEYTSWTMRLLERIDKAVGPGVMEQPIFRDFGAEKPSVQGTKSDALEDIKIGKYDALFQGAPDRPSDLYRLALTKSAIPNAQLVSSTPFEPDVFVEPKYPPIAKAARVEGSVVFRFKIDANGNTVGLSFDSGPVMLQGAVKDAVNGWKFYKATDGQEIQATVAFKLNCPAH